MTVFQIDHEWLSGKRGADEATLARLAITVADLLITKFDSVHGERGDAVEIPIYHLAEWLAGNWWSLLWEPRKSEEEADSRPYSSRHSLLAAQHGFALPALQFVPAGNAFYLEARARRSELADVSFSTSVRACVPRGTVEQQLQAFVEAVVGRLAERGLETDLQEEWALISATCPEEYLYSRCVGSLGLSPYDEHPEIDNILDDAANFLDSDIIFDLCQTSSPLSLSEALKKAKLARAIMDKVDPSDLSALDFDPPTDDLSRQAWQMGLNAARLVRDRLGLDDLDPASSQEFLAKLDVDTKRTHLASNIEVETAPVLGSIAKDDASAKIALLQRFEPQRRFSAARAVYLGWSDGRRKSQHLLTSAVTRQQQASRAFAAEITAPVAFLKKELRFNRRPSNSEIMDIAAKLGASEGVVWKQATNNGLIAA